VPHTFIYEVPVQDGIESFVSPETESTVPLGILNVLPFGLLRILYIYIVSYFVYFVRFRDGR